MHGIIGFGGACGSTWCHPGLGTHRTDSKYPTGALCRVPVGKRPLQIVAARPTYSGCTAMFSDPDNATHMYINEHQLAIWLKWKK